MTASPFAAELKRLRSSRRLSQAKLAELADYDHSFVSRLESEAREPSRAAVLRIADALNLTDVERLRLVTAAFVPPELVPHAASALRAEFV